MPKLRFSAIARLRLPLMLAVVALVVGALGQSALASPRASAAKARSGSRRAPKVRPVPQGFVGVDANYPLFSPAMPIDDAGQLNSMVADGVQSIRVAFNWAAAQPYQGWGQVPADQESEFTNAGGRPIDFAATDEIVAEAAQHGLTVLPTILYAPQWDALPNPDGVATPKRTAPYAEYAAALVQRYGPHGSFWPAHPAIPRLPIRMWQIWNEPNIPFFWPQPFARRYVSLLALAHRAIKQADPSAKVVLGALTNFAWRSIGQIYKLAGARRLFDIVAINGFSKTPADVLLYMRFMRNALIRGGDAHKPMIASEISWPSAQGTDTRQIFDFDTTVAGQAHDIATVLPMIGRQRVRLGLIGFYYFTWIGNEDPPHNQAFQFAGLLRYRNGNVSPKPALAAFRRGALALEHCRRKGNVATRCLKPAK